MNYVLLLECVLVLDHLSLEVLRELLDIRGDDGVVILGHHCFLSQKILLAVVDILDALQLAVGVRELVLKHRYDDLDLVDLVVERVRLPVGLTQLVQELLAVDFTLVDEAHVLRLRCDELLLKAVGLLVLFVDLPQVLLVGLLQLLSYLLDVLLLDLQLSHLGGSHVVLEV